MTHKELRLLHASFIIGGFITAVQFGDKHPSTLIFFFWWLLYTLAPFLLYSAVQNMHEQLEGPWSYWDYDLEQEN